MCNSSKLHSIYVFDFDGTLIHSNEVKRNTFIGLAHTDEEKSLMVSILTKQSLNRYEIIELFCKSTSLPYENLIQEFNLNLEKSLKKAKTRMGANFILRQLIKSNALLFINSATPDKPLRILAEHHFPGAFKYNNIYGLTMNKMNTIYEIITRCGCRKDELIFIGDGKDDYEAAMSLGVHFCAVGGGTLEAFDPSLEYINNLRYVEKKYKDIVPY